MDILAVIKLYNVEIDKNKIILSDYSDPAPEEDGNIAGNADAPDTGGSEIVSDIKPGLFMMPGINAIKETDASPGVKDNKPGTEGPVETAEKDWKVIIANSFRENSPVFITALNSIEKTKSLF